ncbi:MAG: hypothetical protein GVY30_05970 [Chloroflexi bacterium]|nr:hypothetical protein [Chloroflexota bacterium]
MTVDTVAQMTQAEFKRMLEDVVEATVEQKLIEMFGDPDEGLVVRDEVRERLLRQRQQVGLGERGRPLDGVIQELEMG